MNELDRLIVEIFEHERKNALPPHKLVVKKEKEAELMSDKRVLMYLQIASGKQVKIFGIPVEIE